jgi:ankyrin repeat protein
MFEEKVDLIEMADRHGNTPMFVAVRVNDTDCLKLLISFKCNFFHVKRNGNTILHECAINNSIESMIILASYCG